MKWRRTSVSVRMLAMDEPQVCGRPQATRDDDDGCGSLRLISLEEWMEGCPYKREIS